MAVTAVLLKVFKLDIIDVSLSGHPHPLFDIKEEFQWTQTKSVPVVRAVLHGKYVSYSTTLFQLSATSPTLR